MTSAPIIANADTSARLKAAALAYLDAAAAIIGPMLPPDARPGSTAATISTGAIATLLDVDADRNGRVAAGAHIGQAIGTVLYQMQGFNRAAFVSYVEAGVQMGLESAAAAFTPPTSTPQ